jgi:molybdopterin/thiamine biosynthesis adenylyltransferase
MFHLIQVGAGSGGMPVLDMLCREPRITRITLIEPDVYKPHNVIRHLFPASAVGQLKAELARQWLLDRRPDLNIEVLACDLLDKSRKAAIEQVVQAADIGVCAADNEAAKFHWDLLMRKHGKPWTLGEVLSGGIGGFVHWFAPGGPCYGCVASHLKRVEVDKPPTPDYSQPGGAVHEVTIPASKASIAAIASLHALVTLELLAGCGSKIEDRRSKIEDGKETLDPRFSILDFQSTAERLGFTSLLWTLQKVPGIFEEAFRPYRFRIPRSPACLICRTRPELATASPEELDVALDQALARLGNE